MARGNHPPDCNDLSLFVQNWPLPRIALSESQSLLQYFESLYGQLSPYTSHQGISIFINYSLPKSKDGVDPISLFGPIHPIFDLKGDLSPSFPSNANPETSSVPAPWIGIPLSTAQALIPALRLATQLLTSPSLSDWWAWALFGIRTLQTDSNGVYNKRVTQRFDIDCGGLRVQWHNAVQVILREHASRLRICFGAEHEASRSFDTTDRGAIGQIQIVRGLTVASFQGRGPSVIFLSQKFRDFVEGGALSRAGSVGQMLFFFSVASTLCHELAHSLLDSRQDRRCPGVTVESYIGQEDAGPEFGYSLEHFLFGGTFFGVDDDVCGQSGLLFGDWLPALSKYIYHYEGERTVVSSDPAFEIQGGAKSLVPQDWLQALFRDDFWDHINQSPGRRNSLRVPLTSKRSWVQRTYDSCLFDTGPTWAMNP
ncbi:MAG: hypothetical protein M1814_006856 [Vezdaea aestivalis]|nr:MAG: hypothetical protein M1814_006856 [Vezdaea aestivalis]